MAAEFEADLICLHPKVAMRVARAKGRPRDVTLTADRKRRRLIGTGERPQGISK
jgi:hypothetical protein